ncbi:MAG: HU family DNA-binding protein [Acholeplasmataceae bacterium]|nr:HU family DNA-binding protein [Acholeplasmataceae bacterium]MCK9233670.1 HU family DNA-binding protein [Acholeplasmataceae bacterium]MCK9288941.1 HU family DNA-binding protein [Acholeplasmataceae bacterium]MCK9427535.1 HU family DNA-binding protein [Acholeplasmataceae bacterium]
MMNKTELIAIVADKAAVTKKDAETVLAAIVETITETLATNEKVVITGFGTFEVRQRVARSGRDPRTGKVIQIPAQKTPAFRAGKNLKESVR